MADKTLGVGSGISKNFADMLNGSHAEVVVAKDGTSISSALSILNGQSLSGGLDIRTRRIRSVICPADVQAATDLTFQVSQDAGTYRNLHNADGSEVAIKIGANRHVVIPHELMAGASFIKIRLGTGAAPVVATAQRQFTFILL